MKYYRIIWYGMVWYRIVSYNNIESYCREEVWSLVEIKDLVDNLDVRFRKKRPDIRCSDTSECHHLASQGMDDISHMLVYL